MKNFFHILFLIILIIIKVSAAPIHMHDCHEDEHEDGCELCDHIIYNQSVEFSTPTLLQDFRIDIIPIVHQHENHYKSVYIGIPIVTLYYGRPPPNQLYTSKKS